MPLAEGGEKDEEQVKDYKNRQCCDPEQDGGTAICSRRSGE